VSKYLKSAKWYHEAIRAILLKDWDPIGVADSVEAEDEYDSYVPQIYSMLIRREPSSKLFEFLWWAETENMGLCGNRAHTTQVAERLVRLSDELSPKN
jgi:hypothetical protein